MDRRSFLGVVGCALGTVSCNSDLQHPRVYRIGYLHPTDAEDVAYVAFRRALQDLGYVVGRNTILEERFAETKVERMPALAAELVADRVDVIVAVSPTAIRAARAATQTIPIVMGFSGEDPVKSGFAASLSHPGGNTTGVTAVGLDLAAKWIELLRDIVPGLKTVGVLRSPGRADHTAQIGVLQAFAESNGMRLRVIEVRGADQYAQALAEIVNAGGEAVVVLNGPEFIHNRVLLVELVTKHRLASVYQFADFVVIGGLVSYGPDIADLSSRAAGYVDRILKGANPAEMPIEQPRRSFLVINTGTANALGLRISSALLLQADQIIS